MLPKAREILRFLTDHESALTYDFQAIHGLRLSTAVVERDTAELFDLIVWLPRESAFKASLAAEGDVSKARQIYGWGTEAELLLASVNLLLDQNYVLVQTHSKTRISPPKHILSPRDDPKSHTRSKDNANAIAYAMMGKG